MYQSLSDVEQLTSTITSNIRKISKNVNSMQQIIMQLESACSSDNESLRQQLHHLQDYTQQLAKDTNNSLKELSLVSKNKVQKEVLTNDFSDALNAFQMVQQKEADQEREGVKRARAASQRSNGVDFGGQLAPPPGGKKQPQIGYQQQALLLNEGNNLEALREREEAVKKLEQDIMDVNGMFKELIIVVHEQAEKVDSIEANVDSVVIRVQEGAEHLFRAHAHQASARKKKMCLVLSGVAILAIIITIICFKS